MAERENTPDEIAEWAAGISRQREAKVEADRKLVEAIHRPEPGPESEPDAEAQEFLAKLFAPKPGHAEAILRLHGSDVSEEPVPGSGPPRFDGGAMTDYMPHPEPRPDPYGPSAEIGWGPEVEMDAELMFPWLKKSE